VVEKKRARDGSHYHITLASRKALVALPEEKTVDSVFEQMSSSLVDDWMPLGIGKVQNAEGFHAFFVVLSWPSATQLLSQASLPEQYFHITLGFQQDDVHNVPKDASTLVSESELDSLKSLEAVIPQPSAKKSSTKGRTPKKGAQRSLAVDTDNSESSQSEESSPAATGRLLSSPANIPTHPTNDDNEESDGSSEQAATKSPKRVVGGPKKPLSAFMFFCNLKRQEVQKQNPGAKFTEIAKKLSELWTISADADKQTYWDLAAADK
jgi:hypothetical protein